MLQLSIAQGYVLGVASQEPGAALVYMLGVVGRPVRDGTRSPKNQFTYVARVVFRLPLFGHLMACRRALGGVHTKAERRRVAVRGVLLLAILGIFHVRLVALGGFFNYSRAQVAAIPAAVRRTYQMCRICGQRAALGLH